jgi:multicomponent Na+:H+ antiporter subunit G
VSWGEIADVLSAVCLLSGAALSLAAGIGVLGFPDVLSRMHAASKPQVLGLLLILVGVGLRLRTGIDVTTLVLVAIFQLITAPTAAHMVGRAAYRTNRVRGDLLLVDELSDRLEEAGRESEGRTGDVDPRRDLGH